MSGKVVKSRKVRLDIFTAIPTLHGLTCVPRACSDCSDASTYFLNITNNVTHSPNRHIIQIGDFAGQKTMNSIAVIIMRFPRRKPQGVLKTTAEAIWHVKTENGGPIWRSAVREKAHFVPRICRIGEADRRFQLLNQESKPGLCSLVSRY